MKVTVGLDPERVFFYFEEIAKIPHGSGNTDGIRNYLLNFAKDKGLEGHADEAGNVIIKKSASKGCETSAPVILQGHMDMVAVKAPGIAKDMKTEGLDLFIEGDDLGARGTSLGGDDGIAVAYMLAILEDDSLVHPPLEVLITDSEEVGMYGASGLDASVLKGKILINIDSEAEGIFTVGCAGGAKVTCEIPLADSSEICNKKINVQISGLTGGHSGEMIDKYRANACKIAGRILLSVREVTKGKCLLGSIKGGNADNAIPVECGFSVFIPEEYEGPVTERIKKIADEIKGEYTVTDPGAEIGYEIKNESEKKCKDVGNAALFLSSVPNGVIRMNDNIPGLVETSLNLGILDMPHDDTLRAQFLVRSDTESAKEDVINSLKSISTLFNGKTEVSGVYPGWKYRVDSPLRDLMVETFKEMYGREPKVEAIHAGLECGLLASKIEGLDAVSIGPDIKDIHTYDERLSITSTRRVYSYLIKTLERMTK
ncbi:MAG: aminoacyl-histidine dipeptidase [Lachnospiraceae bacterium]|nr:aminoacyl-histidine dipeptidase [Lachnospiraceae bacterium]